MDFKTWLGHRYSSETVSRYLKHQQRFATHCDAYRADRQDCLQWIGSLREQGYSRGYLIGVLSALKAWFFFLLYTKKRGDHPCRFLKLRDKYSKDIQLQELFSEEELELLFKRKERYSILKNRNELLTGLLVYQGISRAGVSRLRTLDIDLSKACIYIPATARTNSRILPLQPRQVLPIHCYLTQDRSRLLRSGSTDRLLITLFGTPESGEGINSLLRPHRALFPGRKLTAERIRQSVIANWLSAGIDLRKVQYMAGHKYPSSTERYRQSQVEKLKELIEKYHPLG